MKVLFCSLKYEYGRPEWGSSFEYQNFFQSLNAMPAVQASFFPIDEEMLHFGKDAANKKLIAIVEQQRPDLLFCFLFTEELKKETIEYITKKTQTKTFNWFADDHWRFSVYSKFWAPLFTAISTTDSEAVAKYKQLGIRNIIKTQWGVNTQLFFPQTEGAVNLDITFVGQNYGNRQDYISYLEYNSLPVKAFGTGWPAGRIEKSQTVKIWSNSKINLNFTESSAYGAKFIFKLLVKLFFQKELGRYKFSGQRFWNNFQSALATRRRQIKSRTFEIPACGGFLLTGNADNLGQYYSDGKEIVIFKDKDDLVEKCQYYLEHENERAAIAKAGYNRTIKEHTYEKRFMEIFKAMGLL